MARRRFGGFGIHGVQVKRAIPTEEIEVIQKFTDIVWETIDGGLLHIEIQSGAISSLHRFLFYDAWLSYRLEKSVRTLVLYVGKVAKAQESLDAGAIQYRVENLYLQHFDGDAALHLVEQHLAEQTWTAEDRITLAFAMHMRYEQRSKEEAFRKVLTLTQQIPDRKEQNYTVAFILGLSAQILSPEQESLLKEALKMTNVVREIEEEAKQKGIQQGIRDTARNLLKMGMEVQQVAQATQLSLVEVKKIKAALER